MTTNGNGQATNQATTVVERIKRDFKTINLGIFFDGATQNYPNNTAIIDLTEAAPRFYTYVELETEVRRSHRRGKATGARTDDEQVASEGGFARRSGRK